MKISYVVLQIILINIIAIFLSGVINFVTVAVFVEAPLMEAYLLSYIISLNLVIIFKNF